jgi:hypothetical protein
MQSVLEARWQTRTPTQMMIAQLVVEQMPLAQALLLAVEALAPLAQKPGEAVALVREPISLAIEARQGWQLILPVAVLSMPELVQPETALLVQTPE